MNMNKNKRFYALLVLLVLTTVTAIGAFFLEINPPVTNVIGSYAAIAVALLAAKVFHVSDGIYYAGLLFLFAASPLGSVLNLYRTFGPYDKIVHFFSGILLAALGMMIIRHLLIRFGGFDDEKLQKLWIPCILFAFLTASSGAGIWEIFEFTADKLAGGGMQRGMVDTLTDMIAGNLGGIMYCITIWFHQRKAEG